MASAYRGINEFNDFDAVLKTVPSFRVPPSPSLSTVPSLDCGGIFIFGWYFDK
jgi:hypothetical protein